jgi:hypothetical protein
MQTACFITCYRGLIARVLLLLLQDVRVQLGRQRAAVQEVWPVPGGCRANQSTFNCVKLRNSMPCNRTGVAGQAMSSTRWLHCTPAVKQLRAAVQQHDDHWATCVQVCSDVEHVLCNVISHQHQQL